MDKVIHSFYSRHCSQWNLFVQNCYFCLSSIYANTSNIKIDLYTDYDFGQLLDCAPYDNINDVFDNHTEYDKIDSLLWAWPKFLALDMCSRDTIHIDGDVFLKDKSCKSLIDFSGHDVVVQHLELYNHADCYNSSWNETTESITHLTYPDFITKDVPKCMPNNGVLGVNNKKLWRKYRDTYWYMCKQCPPGSIDPIGWCVPDIIFEQDFLKQICDKDGYTIKYVLTGDSLKEIAQDAMTKSYQHVCGDKYGKLQICINLIKKKSKKCYDMLKSNWVNIFPEYFE